MPPAIAAHPTRLASACLLALFAIAASCSLTFDSVTYDEAAHLVAGVSYLQTGDFRLNPEHPPLAKMWAAVPLVVGGVESIDPASMRWRLARQRELGFELINGRFDDPHRRDPATRLVPARLAMVVLGLLLLAVIYVWSREAWGGRAGLVSLALAAFSPTLLAHTRFVTTDVPAALGFTATLWGFWRFCRRPTLGRALVVGAMLGAALLLKYSTLLLAPMLIAALIVWVIRPPAGESARWTRARRLSHGLAALALAALVGGAIIWTTYGFRFEATRASEGVLDWNRVPVPSPALASGIAFVRDHHVLPEAYIYGVSYVLSKADRRTFLNGAIRPTGTHLYFPEAFLLKSTPSLLVLVGWLAWSVFRARWSFDGLFLALAIGVYALTAVLSMLNIGHRHLVPLYALLFVAIGALAARVSGTRGPALVLAGLIAMHAASSMLTFPRYLSYFNVLGGGPSRGWHYLVDSNIDWGQDLRRLGEWTASQNDPLIYLAYFGSGDPTAYGIRFRKVVWVEDFEPDRRPLLPGPSDYFAVSVTLLQGMYVHDPAIAEWLARVKTDMTPIARAGDSILIYRLPNQ